MSASHTLPTALAAALLALAPGARLDGASARAHTPPAAPSVQSMIVGVGERVLSPAREVVAGAASVQIGSRRCAVAAGTPLAALIALAREGVARFALRDYGHCGSSPAASAQLFVDALDGQRNSGQNGWEYKVDGRSGSTGAADPSGPQGNGSRLHSGQKVLWFWCVSSAGGCQRTLETSVAAATVAAGASLNVSVRGYENEGRASPIANALVQLGASSARSGRDGVATVTAPRAPGRYLLSASADGLVPSFPREVLVR